MKPKAWIIRHPIAAYIIIAMTWSWSIWSLLFLINKPGGLAHNPPPISFILVVLGGFGPTLTGLLLTRVIYGSKGVRTLVERFRFINLGRWWFTLLIIPVITAITPLLRKVTGYPVDGQAMLGLIGPGIGLGLVAGLMEELGWRGFLLPHLLKRYTPLVSALLTGLIWGGLWHDYADFFGLGDKGLAFWPLMMLLGPLLLTAWSLLLTWVYERTQRNLVLSILMHASISSSALILGQAYTTLGEEITWTAISVGLSLVAAVLIWFITHRYEPPLVSKNLQSRGNQQHFLNTR